MWATEQTRLDLMFAIAQSDPLAPSNRSADETELNAWSLARKVCGLAHVMSLSSAVSARLEKRLGQEMAIPAREARLFMPGIGKNGGPEAHPRFVPRRTPDDEANGAGGARAAAYEWSVSHLRRIGFDALWSTTVGAEGSRYSRH